MSDIFREVDEEIRREWLKRTWDRYGLFIVAAAVLIVVGVGGWRGYQWYEAKRAADAGTAFEAALQLAQDGKHTEAADAFAKLAENSTPTYRSLAILREAEELAAADDKSAIAAFDRISGNAENPQLLRDVAAIRAGLVLVDTADFAEMSRRLEPLAEPGGAMRHSARELLALSAWRNGDLAAARRWGEAVLADANAPADLRARMDILLALAGDKAET